VLVWRGEKSSNDPSKDKDGLITGPVPLSPRKQFLSANLEYPNSYLKLELVSERKLNECISEFAI
jgi:hypothetical protein